MLVLCVCVCACACACACVCACVRVCKDPGPAVRLSLLVLGLQRWLHDDSPCWRCSHLDPVCSHVCSSCITLPSSPPCPSLPPALCCNPLSGLRGSRVKIPPFTDVAPISSACGPRHLWAGRPSNVCSSPGIPPEPHLCGCFGSN